MKGKVNKLKNDFGFIKGDDSNDYFMSLKNVSIETERKLKEGISVEFDIRKQPNKSNDTAINIQIIEDPIVKYFKENVLNLNNVDYDTFCDNAREYAERLKDGDVNTSMIRKVYSRILNADDVGSIKRLRPQFAYIAGRNEKKRALNEFMEILDYLARELQNNEQLECFKNYLEAIVAYRKYVGKDL